MTTYLAQVNVESVYTRYTDNLKGFVDKPDKFALDNFAGTTPTVAKYMLESERDEVERAEEAVQAEGPDGPVGVPGQRVHVPRAGHHFLAAAYRNFQKANMYAERTAVTTDRRPEAGL